MTIGRLSFGIRCCTTKDFKWFYCPIITNDLIKEFHFFWWFGHKWYIALNKKKGGKENG